MALAPLRSTDPARYGPYQLQGRLGAGGMGVVYLAFGPDGGPVALKVLQPVLAEDREYRVRFVREVNAARLVDSPFVARVVAAETDSDALWMATEYVEGATLAHAVESNGPVPADRLRGLAVDLARGVATMHAVGLVHRDLKPANVVLAWSGPKLIDFGIAKHEGTTDLTQTGVTVGSLLWMSPEVLNGHVALRASDIFAWGLCVAFAGTGRPPFGAGNPQAVAYRIGNEPPDLRGLPPELAPLIALALAKDPDGRPDADQLCASLGDRAHQVTAVAIPRPEGGWTGPTPATPATAEATPPAPPPPPNWQQSPTPTLPPPPGYTPGPPQKPLRIPPPAQRRRQLLVPLLVLGALVVAAAVAIAILATRSGSPKPPPATAAPSGSATPTPTSPTPTPTPTSSGPSSPVSAARALDTLLTDSARSRANVVAAVSSAQSCIDPSGAAATLRQAAAGRAEELQRLQLISLSSIDPEHSLTNALTDALTESRAADLSFAAWANGAVGCSGSALLDANFAAANQSSMSATAAKQSFINLWNPIAQKYGLTLRQDSDL